MTLGDSFIFFSVLNFFIYSTEFELNNLNTSSKYNSLNFFLSCLKNKKYCIILWFFCYLPELTYFKSLSFIGSFNSYLRAYFGSVLDVRKTIVNKKIYPCESCSRRREININQIFTHTYPYRHTRFDCEKYHKSIKFRNMRVK